MGYVHFRETGAYGANHCAIEWRRPRIGVVDHTKDSEEERSQIRAEQVLQAIDLVVSTEGAAAAIQKDSGFDNVDLFMTSFAPDGYLQWYPVMRRPLLEMDFTRIAYRAMWLDYLGNGTDKRAERASLIKILSCYAPPDSESVASWSEVHGADFEAFSELSQRGVRTTEKLLETLKKGKSMRKAHEAVEKLMLLDEEMRLFSELHQACRPLVRIARYERDNLEGADPQVLAKTTMQIYRDAFARARLMRKKIIRVNRVWQELQPS